MTTTPTDTQVRDWEKFQEELRAILKETDKLPILRNRARKIVDLHRKYIAADRAYLAGEIEKLNRTDDTQMSEDRIYDEALEDVLAIINTTQK